MDFSRWLLCSHTAALGSSATPCPPSSCMNSLTVGPTRSRVKDEVVDAAPVLRPLLRMISKNCSLTLMPQFFSSVRRPIITTSSCPGSTTKGMSYFTGSSGASTSNSRGQVWALISSFLPCGGDHPRLPFERADEIYPGLAACSFLATASEIAFTPDPVSSITSTGTYFAPTVFGTPSLARTYPSFSTGLDESGAPVSSPWLLRLSCSSGRTLHHLVWRLCSVGGCCGIGDHPGGSNASGSAPGRNDSSSVCWTLRDIVLTVGLAPLSGNVCTILYGKFSRGASDHPGGCSGLRLRIILGH